MRNIIKKLYKNESIFSILLITFGSLIGQGINFASTPIITRIFSPEIIGVFGIFSSIGLILSELSSLTFPYAIVLPERNKEANLISKLAIILAIIFSIIIFLLAPVSNQIANVLNLTEISNYFILFPLFILLWNYKTIGLQWTVREERFLINAKSLISLSLTTNLIKIAIGFFYPLPSVLILGTIAGFFIQGLYVQSKINGLTLTESSNKISDLLDIGRRYKDFAFFRTPQLFVNELSNNIPTILFSAFFGPAYAGFYSMGLKIMKVPSQLLTKSIGDVIYPKLSKLHNDKMSISPIIVKYTMGLAILGVIPFGIVFMFGPQLFDLLLGAGWESAGEYARWLSIYLYFSFMNSPSVKAIQVMRIQDKYLIYEILQSILKITGLIIGYYIFYSDIMAIKLFSVAGVFMNLVLIVYVLFYSKKHDNKI